MKWRRGAGAVPLHIGHGATGGGAGGGGIGLLHTFAAEGDPGLVRVLPEVVVPRAYWLVVHAELRRLPRVRAVAEFLDEVAHAMSGGTAK
jgi:DNA-binding transcriptional LysR family regulator